MIRLFDRKKNDRVSNEPGGLNAFFFSSTSGINRCWLGLFNGGRGDSIWQKTTEGEGEKETSVVKKGLSHHKGKTGEVQDQRNESAKK